MSKENQIEERIELSDIIDYALRDWDDYIYECQEEGNHPIDTFEEWIADAVLKNGYRKQIEGEWQIKSEIYKLIDDVDEELYVECPFCKRRFPVPYEFDDEKIFKYAREHYPYCNCGAKMKGGAEE